MIKNYIHYFILFIAVIFAKSPLYGQAISTFPYFENFETGSPLWTSNNTGQNTTNWELGSPNYGLTNNSHSGTNCWDVNLDTAYGINASSNLETPEFNFSGINYPTLSFWQNRNTELNYDGVHIEYSLNQGASWTFLGQYADPLGTNWYSATNLSSTFKPAWDGSSNGWQQTSYILSAFNNVPSVKFRFVFSSDGVVVRDGVSIDDFAIKPALSVDASLLSILTPINRLASGSAVPSISVLVKNLGGTTLSNYSISYRINGGNSILTNFTTPILPYNTNILTIPGFVVPNGQFTFCVTVNTSGDLDHSNDSLCVNGIGLTSFNIPYTDNFDGVNNGWTVNNPTDTLSKWQLGFPNFGTTNTTHSGNNCWDVNLNTPYSINANTELWSPIFNFSGINNATLIFWQNRYTESTYDGTRLDYSIDGGITFNTLGKLNDTLGIKWYNDSSLNSSLKPGWMGVSNGWEKCTYYTTLLNNQPNVILKYVFTSDNSVVKDGFSIDDFQISQGLSLDASIDSIKTNLFNLRAGNNVSALVVKIRNEGFQSMNNFNVGYRINNGVPIIINYSGTLQSFATTTVNLPGFIVPAGNYSICAFITLSGDLNQLNDSLCESPLGQVPVIPISFNDFESGSQGWITETTGSANTNWQLGTPAFGSTSSAHSGTNAWDINLTTPYTLGAKTYLYSPLYDLNNTNDPWLYFWQNRNCTGNDGFFIEFFDDQFGIWKQLPNVLNVPSLNWYNSLVYDPTSKPSWGNSSFGWKKSGVSLDSLAIPGIVQFRFVFISSIVSASGDGVSIDDVELTIDNQDDAELTSLISPGIEAAAGLNTDVIVTLRNNGIQTLNSLTIKYSNNNGSIVTKNWTGTLLHDSSTVVTLPQVVPSAGVNNIIIYIDWINDAHHQNDTLKFTYYGISVLSPPFTDNLENGNNYWVVTPSSFGNTTWELGSPNYGTTNSSHSGSNCWDINLSTSYGILANTALYSPIFNYSNALTSSLDFWMNYNSEINQDGLRLEYTTNGNTWNVLGILNDPNGTNWYNTNITPQSKSGWSGNSGGWIHCTYNTAAFNGLSFIRYRYVFTSDISLTAPGFSIDDFNVDQTVGFKDLVEDIKFNISPNPAKDELHIHFQNLANKTYSYKIYDISGRLILDPKLNSTISASDLILPINNLSEGVYQLMIIVDGFKKMVSFVKN